MTVLAHVIDMQNFSPENDVVLSLIHRQKNRPVDENHDHHKERAIMIPTSNRCRSAGTLISATTQPILDLFPFCDFPRRHFIRRPKFGRKVPDTFLKMVAVMLQFRFHPFAVGDLLHNAFRG
jgi:hypothetical protein